MTTRDSGARGEELALACLVQQGLRLAARNYRARRCEIDLVLYDGSTLVFAEVKARHPGAYGGGREAVTARKQANIIKAAEAYLAEQRVPPDTIIRFDVVEVDLTAGNAVHIQDAFRA